MNIMQTPKTWRELLGTWLEDPQERQRITESLGVTSVTLTRWMKKESNPRLPSLRKLLTVAPSSHRPLMLALLQQEYPEFADPSQGETQEARALEITSEFYAQTMRMIATVPKSLLFFSLCQMVATKALAQLDPDHLGISIMVVRCMPPSADGKVHSLCESVGWGTPPWPQSLEHQVVLLGAESLAGYAVLTERLQVNQQLGNLGSLSPGYRGVYERSAAAAPIMHTGGICGCLLVSSTQTGYFSVARCALIEHYADLIAHAFSPEDFYASEQFVLGVLPEAVDQQAYLTEFQIRVTNRMREAARTGRPLKMPQAEMEVWQEFERDFLGLPSKGE